MRVTSVTNPPVYIYTHMYIHMNIRKYTCICICMHIWQPRPCSGSRQDSNWVWACETGSGEAPSSNMSASSMMHVWMSPKYAGSVLRKMADGVATKIAHAASLLSPADPASIVVGTASASLRNAEHVNPQHKEAALHAARLTLVGHFLVMCTGKGAAICAGMGAVEVSVAINLFRFTHIYALQEIHGWTKFRHKQVSIWYASAPDRGDSSNDGGDLACELLVWHQHQHLRASIPALALAQHTL